ncbi:MAG: S1C family serine protease [Armatimonadota bacterium]
MTGDRVAWRALWRVLVGSVVLAAGAILLGCPAPRQEQITTPTAGGGPRANEAVLQKIRDAVVLVEVDLTFPDGSASGSGTGFVVNDKGRIVTNAHVVAPQVETEDGTTHVAVSRAVRVIFHAGTTEEQSYAAEVLRENPEIDLALLKIDLQTPTFLELADSDAIAETAPIMVCGHPLGLREISFRTGTVSAHRVFEGKTYLEHDAEADSGNSGGPVVDEQGRVVGVHTQTIISANMSTKWAIPSNVVRAWLTSDPRTDPPVYFASASPGGRPIPGGSASTGGTTSSGSATPAVEELLAATGLIYKHWQGGTYEVPYENEATVYVQAFDDLLRVYALFGDLPDGAAFAALRFNYFDPVGRMSINEEGGVDRLYWEAQVPMGVASGDYLRDLCNIAANQIENFAQYLAGGEDTEPETPTELYPGGDPQALHAQLGRLLEQSGLVYEVFDEENFKVPFDNDVNVYAKIFNGVAYIHAYTGGLPGESPQEAERLALEMLRFNWNDPLGRLALDDDIDVVWECQVPMDYLTADYLYIVANVASNQVGEFWGIFGKIPFNAERFGEGE